MMAVAAMISVSSFAQAWVGGSVSFSHSKSEYDGEETGKYNNVSIAPIFGYDLDEKFAVGAELEYLHSELSHTSNTWAVAPFVRYNFAQVGDVKVFADGIVAFASAHVNGYDDNTNTISLGVRPGICYEFNEKCAIEAHLGTLGWSHASQDKYKSNNVNLVEKRLQQPSKQRNGQAKRKRQINSFGLILRRTLRLKSRGPPKRRISDKVIGSPASRRRSIR